jgi:cyclohexanecarboxyl-CoA dehydrogenase
MTGLSFAFTDEQEQFRQALARFARDRVAPGYLARAGQASYPMTLHAELASLGVLGMGLPEKFGGTGVEDPVTLGIACEEIGAADVNLAAAPVTIGLTGAQLAKFGSAALQERWLPALIDGTELVAFGLTEP